MGRRRDAEEAARRVAKRAHAGFAATYGALRLRQPSFQAGRSTALLRRLDSELLVDLGIGHLRDGRLRDAATVLDRAAELTGVSDRIERFRVQAHGDLAVLTGRWRPPPLGPGVVHPVPGRVLHVVGKSLPHESGYTIRTRSIVRCQRDAGLDPHVTTDERFAAVAPGGVVSGIEVVDGTVHHRVGDGTRPPGMDGRLDTRVALGAEVIERVQPAVLHAASDFLNAEAALAWGQRHGIPVVYEVRGFWAETWRSGHGPGAETTDVYLGRQARELACMQAADMVVTLGQGMRDEIVAQGVDDDHVVVVPNAVDAERFAPGPRDERLAARWHIAPDDVVLGHITSITPYEGLTHLVEATAMLVRAGRPVRALIVGDGPQRAELEALARRLGVAHRVTFTGWVPHSEVAAYHRLIDVFVVPRVPARVCELVTPLKPYEAMAAGRPVLAADLAALAEMVDDGRTGLLFRAGSSEDLAAAADSLVTDADERNRLGGNARSWVVEHRTWAQNGQRYLELYRRLGAVPTPVSVDDDGIPA